MRCFKTILSILLVLTIVASIPMSTYASEETNIPEPIKVVEFSKSFDELAAEDTNFEVVDNAAKPELVFDKKMGQVLKLGKTIIKEREHFKTQEGVETAFISSDHSEYSTINISNPYEGIEHLVEYEPYEDVETTLYRNCTQPLWKEGITISYWIKSPSDDSGYGVNSNVLGFTSERFQIQADDYARHLCTVKFDLEYNQFTDEQRKLFGPEVERAGVLPDSDFYFELASDNLYEGCPIYKDPSGNRMGRTYWMNKFYIDGFIQYDNGEIKKSDLPYIKADYYNYCVAPALGDTQDNHNPGESNLRYAWTYGEMWLDASSSFYFTNDEEVDTQLNPNIEEEYNKIMGMQNDNAFNINSWICKNGYISYDEADILKDAAESPVVNPDEWHYVTLVIQNDWVKYYFDGKEIDVENEYSSFGTQSLCGYLGYYPWKRFNKGTGSRYGYGSKKSNIYWCYYGNYCSPTIMEWITMDGVNLTIGGGNKYGDGYLMYADTDEIYLKNIVFYDTMLTDEQILELSNNPSYYESVVSNKTADVNNDGKITSKDALMILKHAVKLEVLENPIAFDVTCDDVTDSEDALMVLKYSAGLIDKFD